MLLFLIVVLMFVYTRKDGSYQPFCIKEKDILKEDCYRDEIQVGKGCYNRKQLERLSRKHSPYFYMHEKEKYFPVAVEWVTKWRGVNKKNLLNEKFVLSYSSKGTRYRADAPIYVNFVEQPRNKMWIQYVYVAAYNGCGPKVQMYARGLGMKVTKSVSVCPAGVHWGDFEHVNVEVDLRTSKVIRVFTSYHKWGTWTPKRKMQWKGSHPVVYIALGSHALYNNAGSQKYYKIWSKGTDDDDFFKSIKRAVKKGWKKVKSGVKKGYNKAKKFAKNLAKFETTGYLVDYTSKRGRLWKPRVRIVSRQGYPLQGISESERKLVLFKGRFGRKIRQRGWEKVKKKIVRVFKVFRSSGWIKKKLKSVEGEFTKSGPSGLGAKSWFGAKCKAWKNGYVTED